MPRVSRKYSISNFYHVIVQGINKEYIFNTDSNIIKYKDIILEKMDRQTIEILAYCIMNNHAHFLIYCNKIEQLSKFMQKINTSYSRFYNKINNRVGYVFRDRFLSQNILDKKQLYNCINYIHYNPVKAGIVKNIQEYKHSSYNEFMNKTSIVTSKGINLIFGSNNNYRKQLFSINMEICDFNFLDVQEKKIDIIDFVQEIEKNYGKKFSLIKNDKIILKKIIHKARSETDISIVKLADLLEISKSSVWNYLKK